jgi:uncharacterized phage-associated protein
MANVFDVAKYILSHFGENGHPPLTTWKLQKLVYYSQAWSLVWDDRPLFKEKIEAWANGPVCPDLYRQHKGQFQINSIDGGAIGNLRKSERDTIDVVLEHYGKKTAQYLSELTHSERPWIDAREGLKPGERGQCTITLDSMAEYYGGLRKN